MTRICRFLVLATIAALAGVAVAHDAQAQAQAQARKPKPQEVVVVQPEQRCLRALDGSCTNPAMVEAARIRAVIIPSVRVSYLGTPAGTIGGPYIPYERFFQDNPTVFGLPTNTFFCCNAFQRTK